MWDRLYGYLAAQWSRYASLPMNPRVLLQVAIHALIFAVVYAVAYSVRFEFHVPEYHQSYLLATLGWVVGVKLLVFHLTGNYLGWWKYVTFSDLVTIAKAATLSLVCIATINFFIYIDHRIPRTVLIVDFCLTILALGGVRSAARWAREHFWQGGRNPDDKASLFVGADEFSATVARQMQNDKRLHFRIVGFLDPDHRKWGTQLAGIKVLGDWRDVVTIADRLQVTEVLVGAGCLPGAMLRGLMKLCEEGHLNIRVIPELSEFLQTNHRINVREVAIDDLLRRDPVRLDTGAIENLIRGKTVLVTGAGGSIGSEICRQVLKYDPLSLILVEQAENSLFHIERELRALQLPTKLVPGIADVLDYTRIHQIFRDHQPHVVFHAAAHKHVPMMELNIAEAVKNNVLGTKTVADAADEHRAECFVMISTDKAVNPTSVMGTTKHLAERYVHSLSQESKTRFMAVRFGNVLGSAGSVVPIFQEQIRRGGPITITDERMVRFFMSIPEASQLVLQAGTMGKGGEIFVLDMGDPIRIVDLAKDLIRLSGVTPGTIEIEFTGCRPGEKLYEELYFADEETLETTHSKVRAAYHRPCSFAEVCQELGGLFELVNEPGEVIRNKLHDLVPDYRRVDHSAPSASQEPVTAEPVLAESEKVALPLPPGA